MRGVEGSELGVDLAADLARNLRARVMGNVAAQTVNVAAEPMELASATRIRPAHHRRRLPLRAGVDVAAIVAAIVLAPYVGPDSGMGLLWRCLFGALVFAQLARRAARPLSDDILDDLGQVVVATSVALPATLVIPVALTGAAGMERAAFVLWLLTAASLLAGRGTLRLLRAGGVVEAPRVRRTLVIGAGQVGHLIARRLEEHPEFGLRVVGFLDKQPLPSDHDSSHAPVLGASWDLEQVVSDYEVEHLVVTFSTAPTQVTLETIRRAETLGLSVSCVPRLFETVQGKIAVDYLGGIPLITPERVSPRSWRLTVKYATDRVLAALITILLLPVFAAIAVGVLVSLGRPIVFRQTRVGRDGVIFEMLKFRTMRELPGERGGLESQNGNGSGRVLVAEGLAPGGVEGSDRRTPFGAFLRRTSLDELPQLFNVLWGEMSLIGPRPERPDFVDLFTRQVYRYGDRHRVKAGMTGWAQVHGLRGKTSLQDRVEWDNYYIENWSLRLDMKILLMTAGTLIRASRLAE